MRVKAFYRRRKEKLLQLMWKMSLAVYKDALLSNQQGNYRKSGHSKYFYKNTLPQHSHSENGWNSNSLRGLRHMSFCLHDWQQIICMFATVHTRISTSSCSFCVKPLTPFPAEAWPIKVMTLISGAWWFNIAAISCTLSRNDEKIITRVLTSCVPQSGNA